MLKKFAVCLAVVAIAMLAHNVYANQYEDVSMRIEAEIPAAPLNTQLSPLEVVLYDNGPLVTNPGAHPSGADVSLLSEITLGENILGYGHQISAGNRVADDFEITNPRGWNVESIRFYAYQTGANNSINDVNLQIWDGVPGDVGSSVVFGDTSTNRLSTSGFGNIYRMTEAAFPSDSNRPVQANDVAVGTTLGPGTYWLDWQTGGTATSGPWAPPISFLNQTNAPGANARQFTAAGGWAPLEDSGSFTPDDLPFIISGTKVPEPSCVAMLFLAVGGGLMAFRRR